MKNFNKKNEVSFLMKFCGQLLCGIRFIILLASCGIWLLGTFVAHEIYSQFMKYIMMNFFDSSEKRTGYPNQQWSFEVFENGEFNGLASSQRNALLKKILPTQSRR